MSKVVIARRPDYRSVALPRARYRTADSRQGYPSVDDARRVCAELNRRTQRSLGIEAYRVVVLGGEL
jgi:hypothetical protein